MPRHVHDVNGCPSSPYDADFVTEKVHEGRSIMGLYPPTESQTKQDFQVWRKAKGR